MGPQILRLHVSVLLTCCNLTDKAPGTSIHTLHGRTSNCLQHSGGAKQRYWNVLCEHSIRRVADSTSDCHRLIALIFL